ncbi:MAG: PorV/PorQ family protein [Saprospiraceae bacterium]|nr:PorV/PorQ family protein [Saprospiraceae bacterium]MDG2420020.1 PorV/PorQ family protein [Saprospiraceae bacterium]
MNKFIYILFAVVMSLTMCHSAFAGNPDRQGEAGAYELLMNPWARSAGLHSMGTSFVNGVEAMRLNVAGLSRVKGTEVMVSHARYLEGTDIKMNAFGLAQKVGKNGTFGLSLMSMDFGDIPVTTENSPQGTGGTFSPNFFNLGLGYGHIFENKISVGILFRAISESTADLKAFGFALDAGVQYVSGPQDNFKLGLSLRNVGSPMSFGGQGLSQQLSVANSTYQLSYEQRPSAFELPSVLNIGVSYDFILGDKNRLTAVSNFTSNSFSRDQLGAGIEYAFNEKFMLRGGYKYDLGQSSVPDEKNVYTGVSGGLSIQVPVSKNSSTTFGIDYAFRTSNPWGGTHNLAVRLGF